MLKKRIRDPKKLRVYRRRWRKKNPEKYAESQKTRVDRLNVAPGGSFWSSKNQTSYEARLDTYDGLCFYCLLRPAAVFDHRIPISKGGSNWPANIVGACKKCNLQKGARKYPSEWKPSHD